MRLTHVVHKAEHGVNGLDIGGELEDLRADVTVEPGDLDSGQHQRIDKGFLGRTVANVETELGILVGRLDIRMRVSLDTGTDANDDALGDTLRARIGRDALDLLMRIDHETRDTGIDVLLDLALRLVVALGEDMLHRKSRRLGDGKLSTTGHVDIAILLGDDLVHGNAAEGLGGIDDVALRVAGAELIAIVCELLADMTFVVDIERGTEIAGDVAQIDAVEHHLLAVNVHVHGSDLEKVGCLHVVGQNMFACWCN